MGSKSRFTKEILPIILADRKKEQWYVEPFAGGMNVVCEVEGKRIANDIHYYLIEMWKALVKNKWIPPKISKTLYEHVKNNKSQYDPFLVGWVGFNCSYSGKYFGGFAGETKTRLGTIRDYQAEAIRNVLKQVKKMEGVIFQNLPYYQLQLPPNSVVYCDPPYENTSSYKVDKFDHILFWNWVRNVSEQGHTVFVSEYNAPDDFECVWQKEAKSSLSANGVVGGNKKSIEKLFKLKENIDD